MPKKSTRETEVKIAAEKPVPQKRASAQKTAASTHKRSAKPLEAGSVEKQALTAAAVKTSAVVDPAAEREQIARMAYFLWLERGASAGDPEQDWYRAEQLVRSATA